MTNELIEHLGNSTQFKNTLSGLGINYCIENDETFLNIKLGIENPTQITREVHEYIKKVLSKELGTLKLIKIVPNIKNNNLVDMYFQIMSKEISDNVLQIKDVNISNLINTNNKEGYEYTITFAFRLITTYISKIKNTVPKFKLSIEEPLVKKLIEEIYPKKDLGDLKDVRMYVSIDNVMYHKEEIYYTIKEEKFYFNISHVVDDFRYNKVIFMKNN